MMTCEDSQFFNLLNQATPDNVIPMKTKVGVNIVHKSSQT